MDLLGSIHATVKTALVSGQCCRIGNDLRVASAETVARQPDALSRRSDIDPRSFLVTQFGAQGDASKDDTAAIQAALDAAEKAGGGEVFLPAGRYRIEGSLTVPSGVTLRGVWEAPHHSDQSWGSALWVVGGRGQEDGPPAVELRPSSTIRGVTIFYPDQSIDDIQPYP